LLLFNFALLRPRQLDWLIGLRQRNFLAALRAKSEIFFTAQTLTYHCAVKSKVTLKTLL